ncbi:galactonate dehydratase [Frondihabitans sucicola]|uniref:Galactonate dehydratase n=1 Tax=Frondihabitans sucicola TaxID=1268041 RepID=A0ABN6XWK1_9MICO|nr:galactonate dehydratase [Frondihabitans sucicola]BDZ49394.1 galactonate dehydratase [Frondihabitans sucicola]
MRITAVETFVLGNRRVLVKVSTDAGIAGWGEPTLEGWALTARAAVERMAEFLIGQDPRRITRLWQVLSRGGFYRGGPVFASAVAGLDQALWDILGKHLGAPVHELLGGAVRDRVRVYAHANTAGRTGDPASAAERVSAGYTLLKVAPDGPRDFIGTPGSIDLLVAELGEFRRAIGDRADFAVDLHGRFSVAESRRLLPLLEPLRPAFVEEPLRPEHSERIGDIVASTTIPIAMGERLHSRAEFRRVLEAGIAIAQPDPSHAGGITECFRIAALAEVYDVQLAPHCPLGPVALAACLQLDFAVPHFYAQEHTIDLDPATSADLGLLVNPGVLAVTDGHIDRPTGPGLGIDVDEDAVRAAVVTGALEPGSPLWTNGDGSFAEW